MEREPINVNVIVNRHDNRNVDMLIEGAENCQLTHNVEVSAASAETSAAPPARNQLVMPRFERSVQEIFGFEDKSWLFMQSGQFDEAFAVLKRKFDLGKDLSRARELMVYFMAAVRARHPEKASEIRREIFVLLQNNTPATGNDVKTYANELFEDDKKIKAILFFLLSADYHATENNGKYSAYGVVYCAFMIERATRDLIEQSNDSRMIVKIQILPLLEDFRAKIQTIPNVDDEIRIMCDVHCLNHIVCMLSGLQDYQRSIQMGKQILDIMKRKLPSSYHKYHVYVDTLSMLGQDEYSMQNYSRAKEYFTQAIDAASATTERNAEYLLYTEGLESEAYRREQIKIGKGSLKMIQYRLKRS